MNPLISIIIPAYNAEKYIEETLQSVLSQSYQNWECIIVNDGSTDNTLSIINDWAKKDERFIIFSKKNEGLSKARNSGIALAKSDFVAFLDSDDIWMPHHISSLVEIIQKHQVDVVYSTPYYMLKDKNYTTIPVQDNSKEIIGIQSGKEFVESFLRSCKITPSFVLCNKQSLIRLQNFSYYKKAEDYHTWIKMLCNGCVFYSLDLATGYYRVVDDSMSSTDRICTKEVVEIISLFKNEIKNLGINYNYYFTLWARRYFLLKNNKLHYIEAINYINSIDNSYFTKMGGVFYKIKNILPKKLLKLIVLRILKVK